MRVKMVCLEDGITSCGFRKMAAYVSQLTPDVQSCYISTNRFRRFGNNIRGSFGTVGMLPDVDFNIVMTDRDEFVEIQGTAEKFPFSSSALQELLDLGRRGIRELIAIQKKILET